MSARPTFALVIALLAAAACTPKETTSTNQDAAVATASLSASPSAAASSSASPATAANNPLPPRGDVATKARTDITKANYKSELDKLEKEVDQP